MKVMQFSQKLLLVLGISPNKSNPSYSIVKWIVWFSIGIVCIPQSYYLYSFRNDLLMVIIRPMSFILSNLITLAKTTSFYRNRKTIVKMLNELVHIVHKGRTEVFAIREKYISRISRIYASITFIAVTSIIVTPLLDIIYQRPFQNPFNTFYGLSSNTYYIPLNILMIFEFFTTLFMGMFHPAIDVFYWGICLYIMEFFSELSISITSLAPPQCVSLQDGKKNIALRRIWLQHQKILSLSTLLQTAYNGIFFYQFIMTLAILCILIYRLSISLYDANIVVTMLVSAIQCNIQIFTICWFSSLVANQSLQISNDLYFLNWYEFSSEDKDRIRFMIMQSQKVIEYNGFGIFKCNLSTFVHVLNFTGSAITLLQSFR
ncbi:hypothetical protein DMENIID0001_073600 [Sergentomyia squamirostris]